MKISSVIVVATVAFLGGCVNLATICPHKPITQGVFGEVLDSSGGLEENVEVDIFGMENGTMGQQFGTAKTSRGGYQFNANPSTYYVCAKNVCAMITVPTGLVELSAMDATPRLTWDPPVQVPPDQTIGPCKYGD